MTIKLDALEARHFENAINLEWLSTNGLGGYSAGTVAGANSRKYHGYLVVAARPPVDRYVTLSRVEDRLTIGGQSYDLSTDEFPDIVHPQGYLNILSFEKRSGPVWRYQVGDAVIEKSVTLIHGQDTVVVRYELVKAPADVTQPVKLHVVPMFAGRDFHATIQPPHRPGWQVKADETQKDAIQVWAPECPVKLFLSHNADIFTTQACWWYNFVFRQERMRGYPDRDDLWTPGTMEFVLQPGKPVGFVCSTKSMSFTAHTQLLAQEEARYHALTSAFQAVEPEDNFLAELSVAADHFVVKRGTDGTVGATQMSVIAGYPWFEDWGRDTFIALPGLTLVTHRFDAARSILVTFADHLRNGLLPNRFPDKAITPEYHTVDAAMWFVQAAYEYWRYTSDAALLREYLYRPLCEIMDKYQSGTDFGIRMDSDGLIRAGEPHVQLTWMDAKVGDWVVTPRHGKPVEINALWYSNLRIMSLLAQTSNDAARAKRYAEMADLAAASFAEKFYNPVNECLHDVVGDDGRPDSSLRPNQIMAVSLPFSPLKPEVQKQVVDAVEKHLLTPMGLRTLAPGSLGYHGRCVGDQLARDMAYHQGTVWPWLIGPFVSAYVKVHEGTPAARTKAKEFLCPFKAHFHKAGLGCISEIADGDHPYSPRGTFAQAWSVGEVLRAYWEDILAKAPSWPHERLENERLAKESTMASARANLQQQST